MHRLAIVSTLLGAASVHASSDVLHVAMPKGARVAVAHNDSTFVFALKDRSGRFMSTIGRIDHSAELRVSADGKGLTVTVRHCNDAKSDQPQRTTPPAIGAPYVLSADRTFFLRDNRRVDSDVAELLSEYPKIALFDGVLATMVNALQLERDRTVTVANREAVRRHARARADRAAAHVGRHTRDARIALHRVCVS